MTTIRIGILTLLPVSVGHAQPAPAFDLIIRHGAVIDGTGNPRYDADVGIRDGFIAAVILQLEGARAWRGTLPPGGVSIK